MLKEPAPLIDPAKLPDWAVSVPVPKVTLPPLWVTVPLFCHASVPPRVRPATRLALSVARICEPFTVPPENVALPVNVKEVAILVVGGFHKASYEIYAHVAVAERLGMPLPRISALVANVKPADLTHDEATAFDVAYLLCRGGALPDATWRLAIGAFGELGAAQLVYLVGVYAFVSTSLNGFDVPAPERNLPAAPTAAVVAGIS